jgi:hypothetical protein
MSARTSLQFLWLCLSLVVLNACLRQPKPNPAQTDAQAVALPPVKAEADSGKTPPDSEKNPTSAEALMALHLNQVTCVSCHEKDRPAQPHYGKEDCATCHSFPSFKTVKLFTHDPKPATCEGCHARPTTAGLRSYPNQGPPAGFDPNNKAAPGSGHYVGKDCAACHNSPKEQATSFTFTHSAPRADFCLPCHFNEGRGEHANDNDITLRDFGNCFSCHQNFDRNVQRDFDTN